MSDASWVGIGAIAVAAINMIGSVLLAWIRARYPSTDTKPNGDGQHTISQRGANHVS